MEQKFSQASGLRLAGLGGTEATDDPKWMFRRSEVEELWGKLETSRTSDEDLLYISGPPGTGKSTAVWMWAGSLVATSKLEVVWIHLGRDGLVQYVSITSEATLYSTLNSDEWVGFFRSNATDADVVILDGLIEKEKTTAMSTVRQWHKKAGESVHHLIFVASEQLKLGGEDVYYENQVSVCSWTLTDAFDACANDQFWNQVSANVCQQEEEEEGLTGDSMTGDSMMAPESKQVVVSKKFWLCGGSVRWLFGMNFNGAKADIDRYLQRVEKFDALSSGLSGAFASTAVNHVMGLDKDGERYDRIICSTYMQQQLIKRFRTDLILAAKQLSSTLEIPGFAGIVFEADFVDRVKTARMRNDSVLKVKVRGERGDVIEDWDAKDYVEYSGSADLRRIVKKINVGTWLLPNWNQGCFDAVQLLKNKTLRFVQVTAGKSHNLLLNHAAVFIKTLVGLGFEIETIDFVFLGPEGSDPPNLTKIVGSLLHWGRWTKDKIRYLWLPKNAESV
jgi:DNA polymerase III delta prime subunit